MKDFFIIAGFLGATLMMQGCVPALIAGGAVAADELVEDDGEFDPLEEAYDGDDSTDPILEED